MRQLAVINSLLFAFVRGDRLFVTTEDQTLFFGVRLGSCVLINRLQFFVVHLNGRDRHLSCDKRRFPAWLHVF